MVERDHSGLIIGSNNDGEENREVLSGFGLKRGEKGRLWLTRVRGATTSVFLLQRWGRLREESGGRRKGWVP